MRKLSNIKGRRLIYKVEKVEFSPYPSVSFVWVLWIENLALEIHIAVAKMF